MCGWGANGNSTWEQYWASDCVKWTNMRCFYLLLLVSFSALGCLLADAPKVKWPKPKPTSHDYSKWEKDVALFEKQDRELPPKKGGALFVGSSSIVRWKTLAADFPELNVINRGFGGNQIKDSTHYAERMIFPYEPSKILLRAGGNDINAGWPAEDVFADFVAFVKKVRTRLPDVQIYYISLAATVKRLEQVAEGEKMNRLIADYCQANSGLTFIDSSSCTLGDDRQPSLKYLVGDKLHLNELGYRRMTAAVRAAVLGDGK
jgi:lysophospholipase L1-like esterase